MYVARHPYSSLDDMDEKETDALNVKRTTKSSEDCPSIRSISKENAPDRSLSWKNSLKQSLACVVAHSLVIQAGVNMSYSAVLLPQLSADSNFNITMSESTWIASIVTLALPPGSLAVGPLMDKFGRKKICMLTAVPFVCSWIIQSKATKVWHMYFARILAGIAAGLSTVSTVYVSEMSHPDFRPMLLSLNSVFVSFGVLITCVFGFFSDWRTMAVIYSGISAFSFCALFFVPESPHWLLTFKDDLSGVAKSLQWTYTDPKVFEAQYEYFIESQQRNKVANFGECYPDAGATTNLGKIQNYLRSYHDPVIYKPLAILLCLFAFQQFSGAYVIIFYAVDIFRKLGGEFQRSIDAFVALVLLGSIRFVMSIVSAILAKKIGRRTLMMASGIGMSFTSLIAGLYIHLTVGKYDSNELREDNVTLICVLGYVSFSAIGFLVIPWTLVGELLPVRVRGVLSGLLVAAAYAIMFAVVKAFPYLMALLSMQVIFFALAVVNLGAVFFIFFALPETFGKTFAEIERYFRRR